MPSAKLRRMDTPLLQSALIEYFAPWVQALGLKVQSADTDGVVCGQAMMAAAGFVRR